MPGDACARIQEPWHPWDLIAFLLAFVSIGPALWQVDPSAQDLDQIGIAPGADRTVTLAAPFEPWNPAATNPATLSNNALGLTLAMPANTQAVRLVWTATGAPRHRLYRNCLTLRQPAA